MDVFMDRRTGAEIPVPERQARGVEGSSAPTRQLFDDPYALCIESRHTNFPSEFLTPFFGTCALLAGALERYGLRADRRIRSIPSGEAPAQVRQRDKGQKEGQVLPDRELLPEHDVLRNEDDQHEHAWHQPNDNRFRYSSRNDSHRDGGDRTN